MTMLEVPTPDGRILEVLVESDSGFPLVYHSGSPSAAVSYAPIARAAAAADLRLVTWSRPGYGTSTAYAGEPRLADDVSDTVTVLDHLGLADFVTLGWSGGGPRALACAALLPERCRAATSLAGVAPYDAEGLDWFAGMGPENVEEYHAAAQGPAVYGAWLEAEALPMLNVGPDEVVAAMGGLLTAADQAAFDDEMARWIAAEFAHAAHQGVVGMRDDGLLLFGGWGIDLGAITVPTAIWQGDQDAMVPFAHGQWLAQHVAGARSHLLPGEGHLTLWNHRDALFAELREMAGL